MHPTSSFRHKVSRMDHGCHRHKGEPDEHRVEAYKIVKGEEGDAKDSTSEPVDPPSDAVGCTPTSDGGHNKTRQNCRGNAEHEMQQTY